MFEFVQSCSHRNDEWLERHIQPSLCAALLAVHGELGHQLELHDAGV